MTKMTKSEMIRFINDNTVWYAEEIEDDSGILVGPSTVEEGSQLALENHQHEDLLESIKGKGWVLYDKDLDIATVIIPA